MKKIFLTVDTECHDFNKVNQYIYGNKNNDSWGIKKILELAESEQITVNFFLDVGECKKYGDEFIQNVVDIIHDYKQPIFFHLHPEYISQDGTRTFLWMYSYDEKKAILEEAYEIYKRFTGIEDKLVFRAGRYGIDKELVDLLNQLSINVLDLSYICDAPKMCHLSKKDIGVSNCATRIGNVTILPTTRFIGFDYFGRTRCIGLDSADATLIEFKSVLGKTKLSNIVWTMHSWNFIRKWFFLPKYFMGDKAMVRKFKKSVKFAKDNGFLFENLNNYQFLKEKDELINLCNTPSAKILGIVNNFLRFQKIARLNKKYFFLYLGFYSLCLAIVAILLL